MALNTKTALHHFDKFYPYIYSTSLWKSIRLGLLCEPKKMFLINNAYSLKGSLIGKLKSNGAISFFDNLTIKEKPFENLSTDSLYLKHDTISKDIQLNEFVKSTEFIGEKEFYTKSIMNSYTDYTSANENENFAENYKKELMSCQSEMLSYEKFDIPNSLSVLAYPKGLIKKPFPVPIDEYNQAGFYPIDGFSILVVLTMNIKPGDKVLDMCAAPGGKAVAILQTGLPDELVCIDQSPSRIERLKTVLKTHNFLEDINEKVSIITGNSAEQSKYMRNYFDKVLVDAPCSTDRHAATDKRFSLFSSHKYKDRQMLSAKQHNLLRMAIESCKIGGDVVYSTCTLSPVQNDKVVMSVVNEMNSCNTHFQVKIVNCRSEFFHSHSKLQHKNVNSIDWFSVMNNIDCVGQVILPNVLNNYGPGYICKLRKVAM